MYGFVAIKIERKITLLPRLKGGQRTRARLVIPFLIFNDINGPHPNPPLGRGGNWLLPAKGGAGEGKFNPTYSNP